jgi:Chaperone of endosialidase
MSSPKEKTIMDTVFATHVSNRGALRLAFVLILIVLAIFGLSLTAQAVNPAPDGGYPGNNTAEGTSALFNLTSGTNNTGDGFGTLFGTTIGFKNTASGSQALFNNTNGFVSTADGFQALYSQTTGAQSAQNTAIGFRALLHLTTGHDNTALGWNAGANLTTNNTNTNNLYIGNTAFAVERETVRIGSPGQTRAFVAGINGAPVTGSNVVVNAGGQLGVAPSAQRFKQDIQPMDGASEAIYALKPVTFRYKKNVDSDGVLQFGLVAEDVEKVNPALVSHDSNGSIYSVRYDAVNAMSLNEFLKEHSKVLQHDAALAQLKAIAAHQQKQMELLAASLTEHASRLKRLDANLEASKPTPRIVRSDR